MKVSSAVSGDGSCWGWVSGVSVFYFTKAENSAEGTVGVSLRVCDLFAILFTLAVPVGKWFLRWRRAHGGEAKAEPPAERAAVPKTNEPEKRTA